MLCPCSSTCLKDSFPNGEKGPNSGASQFLLSQCGCWLFPTMVGCIHSLVCQTKACSLESWRRLKCALAVNLRFVKEYGFWICCNLSVSRSNPPPTNTKLSIVGSLLGVIWPCANLFSAQFVQHVVVMPVWDTWETYSLRTNASELEVRGALSCAIKLVILFQVFFISSIFFSPVIWYKCYWGRVHPSHKVIDSTYIKSETLCICTFRGLRGLSTK